MKEIKLTQGKVAIVDDEDYEWLNQWKWCCHKRGYATRTENRKTIRMHRIIMNTPDSLVVDHINHDKLDNRKSNLRNCTQSENIRNRKSFKKSTSNYLGVCYRIKLRIWVCQIQINKKKIHIGHFKTEEEAALAYNEAAKKYHGQYANLNKIVII